MSDKKSLSRRKFLQYTGMVTGGAAAAFTLTGIVPAAVAATDEHTAHTAAAADKPLSRARMFFTNALEFDTLSEACERIFPKDENGPGAKELAVPYFIDNQLAGAYGYNAREYTGGPYFIGAPTQGYQTPLIRRDIFKQGLKALNDTAQSRFKKDFPTLAGVEMDQILTDCEQGKIETSGFASSYFFGLLRDATLAGAYSDPMYNGNNNMDGWRMKSYPGAQMAYSYLMDSETFEEVAPISLSSMQ